MYSSHKDRLRTYKICVEEVLSPNWQQTFSDLTITRSTQGTYIEADCQDMAELYGVIQIIFNMGLTLQSVIRKK
ncbi:hypothetical protein ACLKMH_01335 [Psychromonas sp. KJ10-10]|uniref:hypothetical protein n=1 Tax=Psychromonas sp. KJ10-10 TaxID=3391823 RepID=UPI0039B504E6